MTQVYAPRIRETSTTAGLLDFVLNGPMFGSSAFSDVMETGDTCDYCASYAGAYEEGLGTMGSDGKLQRTTIYFARHDNGTVDTSKVTFAAGEKTIVLINSAHKFRSTIHGASAQDLTAEEKLQAQTNLGTFDPGTALIFPQAAAPTGWTKSTTHNDKAIRIVNDTSGGTAGGSSNFSTVFAKQTTDAFTILQTHIPSGNIIVDIPSGGGNHRHAGVLRPSADLQLSTNGFNAVKISGASENTDFATLPALAGTAALGGSNTPFQIGMDIRVKYVNSIIATKD